MAPISGAAAPAAGYVSACARLWLVSPVASLVTMTWAACRSHAMAPVIHVVATNSAEPDHFPDIRGREALRPQFAQARRAGRFGELAPVVIADQPVVMIGWPG